MLTLTNTALPMHLDRLYGGEVSTQAPYASAQQTVAAHQAWQQQLIAAQDEAKIIDLFNPNGTLQHQQHGIDSYLLHVYIHERHHPPFSSFDTLIGTPLTLSFSTPSGEHYRHLHITAMRQLDHDGSYGYYRLLTQPITYQLHSQTRCQVDGDTDVITMIAERVMPLDMSIEDDSANDWTPARITQWQISDWAHICARLSRQGLTAYLRHAQTPTHTPPTLIITTAQPSESDEISRHIGPIPYHQVLHDRTQTPILAISQHISTIPANVTINRFNVTAVSHPEQQSHSAPSYDQTAVAAQMMIDSPSAFAPVIDTDHVDEARIVAEGLTSLHSQYCALSIATELAIADTFTLVGHHDLNQHYRAAHITHLARNSLSHLTGLTISDRHRQRHASMLEAGSHLTQLRLITADTPWVGALYNRQAVPAMTGLTEDQSDSDSRNHMTPTRLALFEAPAQPIQRLEAQAGANYGTHFTHRADDQTLVQSVGDGEHLVNAGSLLSVTRPSLFATKEAQAIESGYRHKANNALSEWLTDHRTEQAHSQWRLKSDLDATVKMGIINPAMGSQSRRDGIRIQSDAQISVKSDHALVLSTQMQTHLQSGQHDYQHHTPTLTQTSLGGQHLTERLTQLATGLDRSVNDHANIKTQLENIGEEQQTKTHQQTPYTLIDSAADLSYVSEDTIVQRSMGEMLTTTQGDMQLTSGDGHSHVSSESMTLVADGSVSMTNAKDNIILSAHTGKLEATAKQDINIASSTQAVEVVANDKITLSAGGASIVLEGTNITISAGKFTEKAGKHSKAGGGMDGLGLAGLPKYLITLRESLLRKTDWVAFEEKTLDIVGMKCRLTLNTGEVINSVFNEKNYVEFKNIYNEEVKTFEILSDENAISNSSLTNDILNLISE